MNKYKVLYTVVGENGLLNINEEVLADYFTFDEKEEGARFFVFEDLGDTLSHVFTRVKSVIKL